MPTIDFAITGLIEKSSLPSFYKAILMKVLPSMSQIQKEDLLVTLAKESDKRKEIEEKGEEICRYYSMVATKLEKNPSDLFESMNYTEKKTKGTQAKDYSKGKLSSIKQKVDLEALKKQVGGEK